MSFALDLRLSYKWQCARLGKYILAVVHRAIIGVLYRVYCCRHLAEVVSMVNVLVVVPPFLTTVVASSFVKSSALLPRD
ncbi:hypothetical protein F5Y03DRAFT_361940 [Xylaria venustula]|nr:hypothetical protein F5Y03DRAFT_361940 [Xylaria venustula]